jgi:hypothetical protein
MGRVHALYMRDLAGQHNCASTIAVTAVAARPRGARLLRKKQARASKARAFFVPAWTPCSPA